MQSLWAVSNFNTRNLTQEAQRAEGQIHLVCPFAFGKSTLGKGLSNFLWHPVQRECTPHKSWYAEQPNWQLRKMDWSTTTTHFILLYTRAVCSPALHCSWVAQKALDWVFSVVIFPCKALGLHQHCPPATHIHIYPFKSHCVPRDKLKKPQPNLVHGFYYLTSYVSGNCQALKWNIKFISMTEKLPSYIG